MLSRHLPHRVFFGSPFALIDPELDMFQLYYANSGAGALSKI